MVRGRLAGAVASVAGAGGFGGQVRQRFADGMVGGAGETDKRRSAGDRAAGSACLLDSFADLGDELSVGCDHRPGVWCRGVVEWDFGGHEVTTEGPV